MKKKKTISSNNHGYLSIIGVHFLLGWITIKRSETILSS